MSLDSETKTALAEELEDVVMELVGISQLSPSQKNITNDNIFQSIQSEIERLNDITELYGYPALHKVTRWVHHNILALKPDASEFLQQNETGLFYLWIELLATLLRENDTELLAELQESLCHPHWHTAINKQDLQQLIGSLTKSVETESSVDTKSSEQQESLEITAENVALTTNSTYQLAWDDDVHPELLEAFLIETPDLVTDVTELIRKISAGNADKETHQSAARIAHTIKGSSAVVGITAVVNLAHKLEDILEYSIDHKLPREVSELLIGSSDCLESMFDSLQTQSPAPQDYPQLLEQLSQWDEKLSAGYIEEEIEGGTKKSPIKNSYNLAWNKDIHPELLEAYMGETPAYVIEISQLLRLISKEKVSSNVYKKASRLSHTIKGTSAVIGLSAVADLSHQLEEILDYAIENPLPKSLSPLLSESADLLESLYDSLLSEGVPPKEYPNFYKKICDWKQHLSKSQTSNNHSPQAIKKEAINAEQTSPEANKTEGVNIEKSNNTLSNLNISLPPPLHEILTVAPAIVSPPPATIQRRTNINESSLRIPVSIIEKLLNFSSELITSNTQLSEQLNTLLDDRRSTNERNERIRYMLDELEWAVDQQTAIGSKSPSNIKKIGFDHLEMDSYNELHSITGLLSESINDDREMSISFTRQLNEMKGLVHTQKGITKELNTAVLNMRMEPIKILTPRLERIVRETCRRTDKKVALEIIGDDIAIDTDVIKGLIDPLLHLLRNAVDHGIESPENRKKLAKDETGKIQLKFIQQGDQVILTLKDDGSGIDAEKIYQLAIKKGLIKKGSKLSKAEKLRLILQAGFSTREQVSDISGRGVGMDVVNTAVKNMSGNITIDSHENKGTVIQLQVPLTLSSANVLLVKTHGNTVAIPNSSIQQVHYLTQDNIITKDDALFISFQEQQIPLLSLSTLLAWPTTAFSSKKNKSVIIIEHQTKYFALYVDEILKPQEITLKTLKPWMTDVAGVNGVCLLANGVVSPVLNMFDLLRTFDENIVNPANLIDSQRPQLKRNKILIVDDSLSNRKALSLILQALDYEIFTAIDGFDALQKIEKTPFQLVITDLEMPKMDGLELIESLRAWPETQQLPIIMVTSRSTEKHRLLADQAGVSAYLTKPVDSATLTSTVAHFLDHSSLNRLKEELGR